MTDEERGGLLLGPADAPEPEAGPDQAGTQMPGGPDRMQEEAGPGITDGDGLKAAPEPAGPEKPGDGSPQWDTGAGRAADAAFEKSMGDAAKQKRQQQALEEQLAGLGLDAAGLFGLLLDSPLLRQTTALAEEALTARAQRQREEAMRGIAALAPELRTPELLAAAPEYPDMQRLLRQNKGMGMLEAFKLAFFDRLTRRQAAAGRQGAINAARGHRHLAEIGGQPPDMGEPTEEQIREYRRYNPRWTVAEIRRFHQEYLDETGG